MQRCRLTALAFACAGQEEWDGVQEDYKFGMNLSDEEMNMLVNQVRAGLRVWAEHITSSIISKHGSSL